MTRLLKPDGGFRAALAASVCWLVVVVVATALNGRRDLDFWEHAAVVRALIADPWRPAHPLFAVSAPHAFESPYALALALSARVLHVDAVAILFAAAVLNTVLFFGALVLFLRRLTARPWITAALFAPLGLLLWGLAPWNWSGFFHLYAFVMCASFPSTFAASLVFVAIWLALPRAPHAPGTLRRAAALASVTALCWLVHPTTALVLCTGVLVVSGAAVDRRPRRGAAFIRSGGALTAGLLLALPWPYFSLIDLLTGAGNRLFDNASHVLYTHVVGQTFPVAVAVIVVAIGLQRGRASATRLDESVAATPPAGRRDAAVVALVQLAGAALAIYLVGAVTGREGLGRAIAWVMLFLQLACAESIASVWVAPRALGWTAPASTAIVIVGSLLRPPIAPVALPRALGVGPIGDGAYELARQHVEAGDVVLADLMTGFQIPIAGGKVIAWRHPVYWIDDLEARTDDINTFFAPDTSDTDRRAILVRRHARWLMLNLKTEPLDRFTALATTAWPFTSTDGRYALLRVRSETPH